MDELTLNTNNKIPIIGFGTFEITSVEPILYALKAGYRHIDTAVVYGNEELVGQAIKDSGIPRNEIFLTTKIAGDDLAKVKDIFEQSLKKLQTNYVDLLLIHFPVTEHRINAWKEMETLYKEGKCKNIGVSNFNVEHLKELLTQSEIVPAVNQIEFHIYLHQKEIREFCQSRNIRIEAYRPLSKGKRNLDDKRISEIALKYDVDIPSIMLRWVVQHDAVVLVKSNTPKRIEENLKILNFQISKEDMTELDKLNENTHYCSWSEVDNVK